jgi:hypothetical protein
MSEIVKEKETNESMKDALYRIVRREAIEMMETSITHKLLKWVVVGWIIVSALASVYRRVDNKCDIVVPLDTYFYAKAICPVK